MSPIQADVGNRLLAGMPRKDRQRFLAGCTSVDLPIGAILAEPGERIRRLYFPTESFISLTTPTDMGTTLEVGMVGNEGMLGISLILGVDVAPLHALVQGEGKTLRMSMVPFRHELGQSRALERVMKRCLYVQVSQIAQTAACTHFHLVEARLARWLLMTHDRAHSDDFHIIHEFLAFMLGVRRVGVTKAASSLQRRRLISYHRGDITILDRRGLEAASCGCYAVDKATYARFMGLSSNEERYQFLFMPKAVMLKVRRDCATILLVGVVLVGGLNLLQLAKSLNECQLLGTASRQTAFESWRLLS